ncbi:peptidyl-prolyl cis-trans isomerase [bacterium]|nr:peptidyl-prolyl cis-trans isomerase [bacterium]
MMKKVLLTTTLLLSILVIFIGCSSNTNKNKDTSQDEIYVKYDGGTITKADFNYFVHSLPTEQQEALNMAGRQVQLLNSMANEEAFYCKAKQLGNDKNPEVLEMIEKRLKPYYINDFYNEKIRAKATVTEDEVRAYYDTNPEFFMEPAKATIRYIQAKDMESAQDIMSDLVTKKLKFSMVSNVKSINAYAKGNDGIIREVTNDGYIQGVGYDAELDSLIFSLPVNEDQIYGPYETETGLHIISILNREESFVKPFSEVKELAETRAGALKQKEISDEMIEDVVNKQKIAINEEVLANIDFENPSNNDVSELNKQVLTSKVEDFNWTVQDLLNIYNSIDKNERMFISRSTPDEILDHLLAKEVYYYQLTKEGFDKELNKTLKYSKNIKNLILSHTYQQLVASQINITDEMIEQYYNENIAEFSKPAYRNIELLEFDSYEKAESAYDKYISAVNNEDSSEIERIMQSYASNSFDKRLINNVYNNGIVPTFGKDNILSSAIWDLPVNEVSDILVSKRNDKPVIFRVTHHETIQYKPLNHVEPQIEGKLSREKSSELFQSLLEDYKKEFNFVIYEDRLEPTITAEELFQLAEKQAKLGKLKDTILYYDQIIGKFNNGKDDYKAMFMKGFTQSEYMNDKQAAIQTFTKFLATYPEGALNSDAQVMLDILTGKTSIEIPDDIEFED